MVKIRLSKDLIRVKNLIGRVDKLKVRNDFDEIVIQLKEMGYKVENIEKRLKEKDESPKIIKRKKEILLVLQQGKEFTASKIGELLGISRNRANEYLKEMEQEGFLKSIKKYREKFYAIIDKKIENEKIKQDREKSK